MGCGVDAIGRNPTDRGKAGSKKSILVDGGGGPLSAVVAGANVHDTKLLRMTLESIVVRRLEGAQNLCLDKGYGNPTSTGPSPTLDTSLISAVLARRNWTSRARKPIQPAVGGGTHPGMAVQVPGHTGAIRQKSHPITLACSNWLLPLSGTAAAGA